MFNAGILGTVASSCSLNIPDKILYPFKVIGNCGTPLGLICIGTMISFNSFSKYKKELLLIAGLRLIIMPSIFVPIAIFLGFRNIQLAALTVLLSGPAATTTCPMAYEMGGDDKLAGIAVAVTSTIVLFTLFVIIFILKFFHFI